MALAESLNAYRRYYVRLEPVLQRQEVRTYMGLILFLLTVSFFIVFAVRPTLNTIASLNKQIEDGKNTELKLEEKIQALSKAQDLYNNIAPDLPIVFASVPDNPAVPPLAKYLEGITASSDLTLDSLQFSPVDLFSKETTQSAGNVLNEYAFSMVVSGEYKNLITFSEILRKVQRLMVINGIKIGGLSNQPQGTILNFEYTGKTFFLK